VCRHDPCPMTADVAHEHPAGGHGRGIWRLVEPDLVDSTKRPPDEIPPR
jgi:hypothetical protein